MSGQGRLFPLQIKRTEPAPFNSADCKIVGVGDDGLAYILKRVGDAHPLVPATEYVCTQLAQHIGLPVSPCHVAVLPGTGELAFASREEGGALDSYSTLVQIYQGGLLPNFVPKLSAWYAYDLFTHNVDRHIGNFLFRKSMLGQVLIGIDFSRALLIHGWPQVCPPLPWENTVELQQHLHSIAPYPTQDAVDVIDRLSSVSDDWLSLTLGDVPSGWLDGKLKSQLGRWWRIGRQKRLRLLRKHLDSGRYLRLFANPRRP